jgi:RNA polymerase sigma-70 factor (ECF subfamily)
LAQRVSKDLEGNARKGLDGSKRDTSRGGPIQDQPATPAAEGSGENDSAEVMATMQHGDDARLVGLARKGELGAFDTLVTRYQRQATAVAFRLLNNMDDAMEITQDAFLNAYDKLAALDDPERFGSWVLRIVSNLALNRRRSRSLRRMVSLDASADGDENGADMDVQDEKVIGPDQAASAEDVRGMINKALASLPEMQRQALVLFSVEQIPQKEVAEMLKCSVEAVKWHVFTARKKLKERLKDYL